MTGQGTAVLKKSTAMAIGGAVVMIVLGFSAVFMSFTTGVGVNVFLGWILVGAGFAYFAYAFSAPSDGEVIWRILIGFLYVFAGFYLLTSPQLPLKPLTFLVAAIVFLEALLEFIIFSAFRPQPGATWILFDGIATVLLAYLIFRSWPSTSTWAIGFLVGIKFVVSGVTRLMFSVTARQTLKPVIR
ncbi:MAG: DUF308 domain-containing protein [Terriglobales bacterium]